MITRISLEELNLNPEIQGPIWSHGGAQMDVNILYFDNGEGVAEHINHNLDVWLIVLHGSGEAHLDGVRHPLEPGTILYIPAGHRRGFHSTGGPLVYASAHQKRRGLMPE